MVQMSDTTKVNGRLLSLKWPKEAAGATLSFDTSQLQEVKAEIEDAAGVTHRLDVIVKWDADYLIGKEVCTQTTSEGTTLAEI